MKIHRGYNLIGRLTDLKNMYMICTNEKLQQKKMFVLYHYTMATFD
jgi:hypothetical protein